MRTLAHGLRIALATAGLVGLVARVAAGETLTRQDPRFDALVPRGAVLEKLADGFAWVEGPVWHRRGGF